jgi:FMN phosphatase YigB (HAD superfamily)
MNQRTTPHLIFDLSEVLIPGLFGVEKDLSQKFDRSENEILQAFEAPPFHGQGKRFHRWMTGELDFNGFSQELINILGLPPQAKAVLEDVCRNCFFPPYPHTVPLLEELKESHRLFLISDHMDPWTEELEEQYPFLHDFEKRIWSCKIGATKSEGTPFKKLLSEAHLNPTDCLFIDDHPPNLEIASTFGLQTFHFTGPESVQNLQRELKDFRSDKKREASAFLA